MITSTFSIPDELKKLPPRPGVYIMKNEHSQVIYVGKAVNLRNRVRSYFRISNLDVKTRRLSAKINHFEYIVTDSEVEALILESNLIKQHTPKYNIRLKDSKAYPYIKITEETLPRIVFSHQREQQKRARKGSITVIKNFLLQNSFGAWKHKRKTYSTYDFTFVINRNIGELFFIE